MKNCLAVLGIVLLSAVAASAQTPPPSPVAAPEPVLASHQSCLPVQNTGPHRAGGSTCLQARNALQGVLINAAACGECGFCSQYFSYGPCEAIQGGYTVPGNLQYSCRICPQ